MSEWRIIKLRSRGSHHRVWIVLYHGKLVARYRSGCWQMAVDHVMTAHRKFDI